jgi:peptidoglycan-associated lipoprotein
MKQRSFLFVATVAATGAWAAACSKPPVPLQPRPVVNLDSLRADSIARARADSIRNAELARQEAAADSLRRARELEQRESAVSSDAMNVLRAAVYFDYDQATLTPAAQELLAAKVPILRSRPRLRLLVTGHTDSRGSLEYNIALGLRRAATVKEWLVANGIESSRIEIMSMGEEQPAVEGEGEFAWSQNRRAEFEPLAAGE